MDSLMKYIGRTSRCAVLYRSQVLEPFGLNGHQHSYIVNICQNPGISQDQLAKKIYVNKSNVARQVSLLEQNGFVTRTPLKTDRRQLQVFPTEKALELYPKVREILVDWNQLLLADFTESEKALLLRLMENVMEKAVHKVFSGEALQQPLDENAHLEKDIESR